MKSIGIAVLITAVALSARASDQSAPPFPDVSPEARALLLDEAGEPTPGDFAWVAWAWSDDESEQADWRALKDWLTAEQKRQTEDTRAAVAALVGDGFDPSVVKTTCRVTTACFMIQEGAGMAGRFEDETQFEAALAQALLPYKAYRFAVEAAQTTPPIGHSAEAPVEKILVSRMFVDQLWRKSLPQADLLSGDASTALTMLLSFEIGKRDIENTAYLRRHVGENGWPSISRVGKEASNAAWLLVQHADFSPQLQIEALRLMEPLLEAGDISRSNYAYLYDRVQVALSRPQRYGTQFYCADGKMKPLPLEDEAAVDRLRAEMELTPLAEYAKFFSETCGL